ncbi:hypothetical protein ATG_11070 [Desulfurococcaceae archaeon AG1]|nr:hypothetical protein ATG_11070 [Desulfurococcaceae archaeon AG1]
MIATSLHARSSLFIDMLIVKYIVNAYQQYIKKIYLYSERNPIDLGLFLYTITYREETLINPTAVMRAGEGLY